MKLSYLLFLLLELLPQSSSVDVPSSVTTYAPIPTSAAGPPVPNSLGYRLQSFGDGSYMVTDGVYQGLFFVSCEGVIVVDAPPTIGENIIRAIRTVTDLPVSHVVYSHSHADHIGAAYLLGDPSSVTFVAHQLTAEALALAPDYGHRPAPTLTFETSYTLEVCNQTLQLDYNGPNHEPGNIFIFATVQKLLMLVDIIYPGWIPFNSLGEVQNVPGFVKAHEQILEYDFDYYIGGHLNRAGTRQDVLIQQEYIQDLYNACVSALEMSAEQGNASNALSVSVLLPPVEKANPGNSWAVFRAYLDALAEYAANVTIDKWVDKLAGTDVFALSNANVMLESVRIDWGVLGPYGVSE